MKRIYLMCLGLIIGAAILSVSCSSVTQSGAKGDKFYSHLKNGNYEMIISLLDEQAIKAHPKEKWMELFESRNKYWGKLVSYKNIGYHTEKNGDLMITKLDYTVDNLNGKVYERINFIKRGDDFKILAYEFNPDKTKLSSN